MYSQNWQTTSIKDAIKKFVGDDYVVTHNEIKGKKYYLNDKTGIQIVEDVKGKYFRIQDTKRGGTRDCFDLDGKIPMNITEDGKQRGITRNEYQILTHFNIGG